MISFTLLQEMIELLKSNPERFDEVVQQLSIKYEIKPEDILKQILFQLHLHRDLNEVNLLAIKILKIQHSKSTNVTSSPKL